MRDASVRFFKRAIRKESYSLDAGRRGASPRLHRGPVRPRVGGRAGGIAARVARTRRVGLGGGRVRLEARRSPGTRATPPRGSAPRGRGPRLARGEGARARVPPRPRPPPRRRARARRPRGRRGGGRSSRRSTEECAGRGGMGETKGGGWGPGLSAGAAFSTSEGESLGSRKNIFGPTCRTRRQKNIGGPLGPVWRRRLFVRHSLPRSTSPVRRHARP